MCTYKGFRLPENMNAEAQYFIKATISKLKEDNKIDESDQLSIFMLADALEEYFNAKSDIATNGATQKGDSGRIYINPNVNIAHTAWTNITNILRQFGGTPLSRGKIKYVQTAQGSDPLVDLLNSDD